MKDPTYGEPKVKYQRLASFGIFESLAMEIINQVRQSDHYDQETRDSIAKLIGSECPSTPIIKDFSDDNVIDQNCSDTINIRKKL